MENAAIEVVITRGRQLHRPATSAPSAAPTAFSARYDRAVGCYALSDGLTRELRRGGGRSTCAGRGGGSRLPSVGVVVETVQSQHFAEVRVGYLSVAAGIRAGKDCVEVFVSERNAE